MTAFQRIFTVMTKPWVVLIYFAFLIVSFMYFDKSIATYFYQAHLHVKLPFLYMLTQVGVNKFYLAGLFSMAVFFRYIVCNSRWEVRCWFLWLCVLVPTCVCAVLKMSLGRARPEMLFEHQLYGFYGPHKDPGYWSFPSGHTTTIMGLVFGLIILFPRYCYAWLVAGLAVVSTRVLLTNHYLSDVLASSYLVLLEIAVLLLYLRRKAYLTSSYSNIVEVGIKS